MNPLCSSYTHGNPSKAIFRHATKFFGGCLSHDAWTTKATFSKPPETKWRERHFICFGFVLYYRCFQHSQPPFFADGFSAFILCSFGCSLFCRSFGFRECI